LAVSDDGRFVLAAPAPADGGRPVWFGPDGQAHEIPVPAPSAFAFYAGSHGALFVSSSADQNWFVADIGNATKYLALPGYGATAAAVAVEFSSDSRRFYVANSDGTVAQFDFQGGPPAMGSCHCAPTGLQRMRGDSVFLLNGSGATPFYLLDGSGAKPRAFFIPFDGGNP
jgi:hypothetical protein